MTNQLTQAELIDLAKEAGFKETVWSNILGVNVESLPKFAQLIQERQSVSVPILKGIGKINGDGLKDTTKVGEVVFVWSEELPEPFQKGQYRRIGTEHWTASTDQYDFQPATVEEVKKIFADLQAQNDANKLVAQALEKAAGILDSRAKEWDNIPDYGCSYAGELRFNARAIRALIAKPIEPVVKDSLTAAHPPAAAVDELVEALKYAKEVIQAWHGGDAWDIYEQHSPEMKQINQALAKVKGEK